VHYISHVHFKVSHPLVRRVSELEISAAEISMHSTIVDACPKFRVNYVANQIKRFIHIGLGSIQARSVS